MAGAPAGTTMAPALAGSPRVQGHRDYVIKVLLNGLTGPLDGKTYREVMVPMGVGSTDEWVAGIASYVRTAFGNSGGLVTPADVARVRAATASRKTVWTLPELEATMPHQVDAQQLKLSASVNAEAAANAATLRGWNSGGPQASGMWFQIELSQPSMLTEVQFDSLAAPGGGAAGRGGRGAAPGAAAPNAPPAAAAAGRGAPGAPAIGFPRGYSVQTSTDGTTWSKPVAEGKGEGSRTSITFAPTRAKFVKITQTDAAADAPAWSISNLRVYAAPADAK
jgi:hypothetical protein